MSLFPNVQAPELLNIRVGSTDYLDLVNWDEFEGPYARGFDRYGRPFFCLKGTLYKGTTYEAPVIYTIFQRYTDAPKVVLCKSHCTPADDECYSLFHTTCVVTDKARRRLEQLLQRGFLTSGEGEDRISFQLYSFT